MKTFALLLILASATFGMGTMPVIAAPDVFLRAEPLAISKEAYNLIIKHEVGGGPAYYNRYLIRPAYVSENSGITIGIGYDLRFNTRAQIAADWKELSPEVIKRLQAVSGVKGTRTMARTLQSVVIPWDIAQKVYQERTIPRFAKLTEAAYPGTRSLHPHEQGAMLSWVFNRGQGISPTSTRDIEKRLMRRDIPNAPKNLPAHFRSSKRIWVGTGLDGLPRRREDEARVCELTPR
jgi:GH24 family phage-related lysozyme (muramidase)